MDTEKQYLRGASKIISKLRRLETTWDNNYWLYAAEGTLHLMRKNELGERAILLNGSIDPNWSVTTFPGLDVDGGAW